MKFYYSLHSSNFVLSPQIFVINRLECFETWNYETKSATYLDLGP